MSMSISKTTRTNEHLEDDTDDASDMDVDDETDGASEMRERNDSGYVERYDEEQGCNAEDDANGDKREGPDSDDTDEDDKYVLYDDKACTVFAGDRVRLTSHDRSHFKDVATLDDALKVIKARPWAKTLRGQQMISLLKQQRSAEKRLVQGVVIPCLPGVVPGSFDFVKWFLKPARGTNMNRSAAQAVKHG